MDKEHDQVAFDQLANQSIHALGTFLAAAEVTKEDVSVARIAASILGAWTRHKQTEGARDATTFMMARELAKDTDELRNIMTATLPSSPLVKAINAPKSA